MPCSYTDLYQLWLNSWDFHTSRCFFSCSHLLFFLRPNTNRLSNSSPCLSQSQHPWRKRRKRNTKIASASTNDPRVLWKKHCSFWNANVKQRHSQCPQGYFRQPVKLFLLLKSRHSQETVPCEEHGCAYPAVMWRAGQQESLQRGFHFCSYAIGSWNAGILPVKLERVLWKKFDFQEY